METENWINEILDSAAEITKVAPSAFLFSKIQNKINENHFSNRWVWVAAASFAVLLALNASIVLGKKSKTDSQTAMLASTISKSNQLY